MGHLICLEEGFSFFFFFFFAPSSTLKGASLQSVGGKISPNSLPIVNTLDWDTKAFLWWELSKCFVCQSATEHPIVSPLPAYISLHSWWCPFVTRQQLPAWPFNETAVPGTEAAALPPGMASREGRFSPKGHCSHAIAGFCPVLVVFYHSLLSSSKPV